LGLIAAEAGTDVEVQVALESLNSQGKKVGGRFYGGPLPNAKRGSPSEHRLRRKWSGGGKRKKGQLFLAEKKGVREGIFFRASTGKEGTWAGESARGKGHQRLAVSNHAKRKNPRGEKNPRETVGDSKLREGVWGCRTKKPGVLFTFTGPLRKAGGKRIRAATSKTQKRVQNTVFPWHNRCLVIVQPQGKEKGHCPTERSCVSSSKSEGKKKKCLRKA